MRMSLYSSLNQLTHRLHDGANSPHEEKTLGPFFEKHARCTSQMCPQARRPVIKNQNKARDGANHLWKPQLGQAPLVEHRGSPHAWMLCMCRIHTRATKTARKHLRHARTHTHQLKTSKRISSHYPCISRSATAQLNWSCTSSHRPANAACGVHRHLAQRLT